MPNFAILFLMTYVVGIGSALFIDGVWAFYLYQLVYFFNPSSRWWSSYIPGLSYSFIVSVVLLFSFFIRFKRYKTNKIFSVPQTKWLMALIILYALISFIAVNPFQHEKALIALIKLFIVMYVAFKLIDTVSKLDFALWAFILGAVYIGLEAQRIGRNGQGRVEGIGTVDSPEANGTAAAIAPTLILIIFYLWQGTNKKVKAASLVCGAIIANGVVLINSRGSFVGLVCGAGYFLLVMLFGKVQQSNQKRTALLVILVALTGVVYVADDLFWDRMITITSDDEGESGSHRTEMWLSAIDLVQDYPFGVGAVGFQTLSPIYVAPELFFGGQKTKAVHSSWFQSLSELGWLGLLLFVGLIASCFKLTYSLKKSTQVNASAYFYYQVVALEGALICYLGAGTFIDQFRAEVLYWLVLFIACLKGLHVKVDKGNVLARDMNSKGI